MSLLAAGLLVGATVGGGAIATAIGARVALLKRTRRLAHEALERETAVAAQLLRIHALIEEAWQAQRSDQATHKIPQLADVQLRSVEQRVRRALHALALPPPADLDRWVLRAR